MTMGQTARENYTYLLGELQKVLEHLADLHSNVNKWDRSYIQEEVQKMAEHLSTLYHNLEKWSKEKSASIPLAVEEAGCHHQSWRVSDRNAHGVEVVCVECGKEEADRFTDYPSITEFQKRDRNIVR